MKTSAVLVGTAIGDALGAQFETKRFSSPLITGWDGKTYGLNTFHKCRAGQYTDDTAMSKALAESLIEANGFDENIILKNYLKWYSGPDFRGAGINTTEVLFKIKLGATWQAATSKISIGNGTAMRAASIGVFYGNYRDNYGSLINFARKEARLTHDTIDAQEGSVAIAFATAYLLNGGDKNKLINEVLQKINNCATKDNLVKAQQYVLSGTQNLNTMIEIQQKLGAKYTVVETVARSLYVFLSTNSFHEAVEVAIRGGGDTDTAAAIVGALAGAYYGLEGIPDFLITPVEGIDEIKELDIKLFEMGK